MGRRACGRLAGASVRVAAVGGPASSWSGSIGPEPKMKPG